MTLSHSETTPISLSFLMPVIFVTAFLNVLCITFCAYYLALDSFMFCGIGIIHLMIPVSWLFFDPILSWTCTITGVIYLLLFPGISPPASISLFASGVLLQFHFFRHEKSLSRQELFISEQKTQINTLLATRSSVTIKLARTKDNIDRLSRTKNLSESLCGTLDMQAITESVCSTIKETIPHADMIRFYLLDKDMQHLSLQRKYTSINSIQEKTNDGLNSYILLHGKPLLITDTSQDRRFRHLYPSIKSILCTPLRSGNSLSGLIRLDAVGNHSFELADLRFLSNITHIAGLAVQNATLYQAAHYLSITDGLTGLYTHAYLQSKLQGMASNNTPFCLIFMDLDNFKDINDNFGHPIGDQTLITISRIITSCLTAEDCAARYGGEEFALILNNCLPDEGLRKAELIREYIENTSIYVRRRKLVLTISAGIGFYPDTAKDPHTLLNSVDRALYKAKSSGKNKVVQA